MAPLFEWLYTPERYPMVQTRNTHSPLAAEVGVRYGGGDDGEEMMMMALGGVGWQQWWYKWSGEAAAVMSQPTESTQGMHRTPSTSRPPNPKMDTADLTAPKRSIVIRFHLPKRRSTRLTPPALVLTVDKADEMILQDTLQIEKMVEGSENVIDDSLLHRNDELKIPGTRLEPKSDKESPEVEITNDKEVEITNDEEVEITNDIIPMNVNEEEEEITDEVYELKGRETRRCIRFISRKSFDTLADHLQEVMVESLPTMVDSHIIGAKLKIKFRACSNLVPVYVAERAEFLERQKTKKRWNGMIQKLFYKSVGIYRLKFLHKFRKLLIITFLLKLMRQDQDDPHDDAYSEGENRTKRQKTSEYEDYMSGESLSGQVNENEQGPSTSGIQEQEDYYDFWTVSYASDDDEIPTKQMSQDVMEVVSLTIDEAKLKKMVDEMLRQRCTFGDEHQYHIDQMKNFLKSDILWESRKEILVSPHLRKTTPLVQSCQRDPEAPPLSLINQDLLYLKKGSSRPENIILSLHKFPAIIFNDDDIEE
ncbi:hypothetical protein Tco_0252840 [Tanacetum coccineum]